MKNLIFSLKEMKTVFVFILMFFAFSVINGQHQIRHYDFNCGTPGYDFGRSIINRNDNGYGIAGYSYQSPACIGSYDWMFLKLKADGTLDCSRLIGAAQDDKSYSLIQSNSDSGYVMAGYTTNTSSPYRKKATLVKLNKNCNLSYARALNDSLNSTYYQIVKDPSNTWASAGFVETHLTVGIKRNKILVTQNASTGALIWGFRYASTGLSKEEAYSICFQPAGGVYGVAARTNYFSGSASIYDILLVKLDYTGNVIWKKVYRMGATGLTFTPNTEPRKIIPMPDGGFTVVGFTNVNGSVQSDVLVFRVNSTGGVMWSYTYGSLNLYEQGESIVHTSPNLVLTGTRRTFSPAGPPDAFIMKIPEIGGAPVWTRRWDAANPTDAGYDIINSGTGTTVSGYAVTGHTDRPVVGNDPFLWRTNSGGYITGTTCNDSVKTPYRSNMHRIDSFALGRLQVIHTSRVVTETNPPVTVTTLCLGGPTSPYDEGKSEKEIDKKGDINEYVLEQNTPNPFNPVTTINFSLPLSGKTLLKVFDISGRLVSTLVNEFKEQGSHKVTFDGSNLSSGVYYYKIESEGFTSIRKMILIK